ncbi:MAG: hypothetical protein ACUVWA_06535 [Candidatus Oleimicrobiaceae bacterium]
MPLGSQKGKCICTPEKVRLWRINDGKNLCEQSQSPLKIEARLEGWLAQDISILHPKLRVIGRQVETGYGGVTDLLCLDRDGDLIIVELQRDKIPREIIARVLDHPSWVKELSNERITAIAESYLGHGWLEEAFNHRLAVDLPETLNENRELSYGQRSIPAQRGPSSVCPRCMA